MSQPICRKCAAELHEGNWTPSFRKANNRICRPCRSAYAKMIYDPAYHKVRMRDPAYRARQIAKAMAHHNARKDDPVYRERRRETTRRWHARKRDGE